jgi:hypothetical protein
MKIFIEVEVKAAAQTLRLSIAADAIVSVKEMKGSTIIYLSNGEHHTIVKPYDDIMKMIAQATGGK